MIVLDTHAWLWWVASPSRLSRRVRTVIEEADRIGLATISCWELAMLVARGRIGLDRDVGVWVSQALAHDRLEELPLTTRIAVDAALLSPSFPGDPADRIIYATARAHDAVLITKDKALRAFDRRGTLW